MVSDDAILYVTLIFMIAMLVTQLYMVGRNKWIHLAAFMSLFVASISMLTSWGTLYYVPFGFIMLSLLVFVFGMLRD